MNNQLKDNKVARSESGKDVQPIGDDKAMNRAKQPATGKVVLLPTHRGTVSSGTEGSGRTLEGSYCIKQEWEPIG